MTEPNITQAEKGFMWLQLSELYQKLAEITAMIGLGLIPALLFVAVFAFIFGGNVPGALCWLGISEIFSWALFGLCTVLGKHYEKKFLEFAEEG